MNVPPDPALQQAWQCIVRELQTKSAGYWNLLYSAEADIRSGQFFYDVLDELIKERDFIQQNLLRVNQELQGVMQAGAQNLRASLANVMGWSQQAIEEFVQHGGFRVATATAASAKAVVHTAAPAAATGAPTAAAPAAAAPAAEAGGVVSGDAAAGAAAAGESSGAAAVPAASAPGAAAPGAAVGEGVAASEGVAATGEAVSTGAAVTGETAVTGAAVTGETAATGAALTGEAAATGAAATGEAVGGAALGETVGGAAAAEGVGGLAGLGLGTIVTGGVIILALVGGGIYLWNRTHPSAPPHPPSQVTGPQQPGAPSPGNPPQQPNPQAPAPGAAAPFDVNGTYSGSLNGAVCASPECFVTIAKQSDATGPGPDQAGHITILFTAVNYTPAFTGVASQLNEKVGPMAATLAEDGTVEGSGTMTETDTTPGGEGTTATGQYTVDGNIKDATTGSPSYVLHMKLDGMPYDFTGAR